MWLLDSNRYPLCYSDSYGAIRVLVCSKTQTKHGGHSTEMIFTLKKD